MLQIEDTLVSLDIIESRFLCDLSHCKGMCCVDGDSGAPLEAEEVKALEDAVPAIWDDLSPEAQKILEEKGVAYVDSDGDLVTSIVGGKNCIFTTYTENGTCICAIEKAYRAGKVSFYKPISCHLYPIRITEYPAYTALNYDRWKVCKAAEILRNKENLPVYRFLKEPLIRKFGPEWYNQLVKQATEWEKHKGNY